MNGARGAESKPATAARIYDYLLGGIHNFPADRAAARTVIAQFPFLPAAARANRAFVRRAVRFLVDAGIRQFLDIGSGLPVEGNVHEIAQQAAPDVRVVYVDIDPVAVAESQEFLHGNERAAAFRADMRDPRSILDHPALHRLLGSGRPTGLLMTGVLHFIPEDTEAYGPVARLVAALAPGSYLALTHGATETLMSDEKYLQEVYRRQTSTPSRTRTWSETARFFTGGVELLDPGLVWVPRWRPAPDDPAELADLPEQSCAWAGVGRIG